MYIGTGIFLLVVGAILSFAVRDGISGVDLTLIGYICMGASVLAILLSFLVRGGGVTSRRVVQQDPSTGTTVEETRTDGV